jgi:hypothetical protein
MSIRGFKSTQKRITERTARVFELSAVPLTRESMLVELLTTPSHAILYFQSTVESGAALFVRRHKGRRKR